MTDPRTDAQLAIDHLAGDRSALAAMFDRFGPALYDTAAAMTGDRHDAADLVQDVFVAAAEKIGQLRDPERLKPWLFAILRNEVYRRTRRRARVRPVDFGSPEVPEMVAAHDPAADGQTVVDAELAELVRSAAAGLDERDQLMLELSVRQGLQGADLAAAMGVTPEQSYTLVHRMRERVERSLGALVVARAGRRDCPELAAILQGWTGEFTILIRKRVARHVDACDTCTRTRATAAPIALLGAAPAFAMPIGLRDRVLTAAGSPGGGPVRPPRRSDRFDGPGGFPGLVGTGTRFASWVAGAAAVLLLALGGAVLLQSTRGVESATPLPTSTVAAVATAAVTSVVDAPDTAAPTSGPTTSAPRATTTTAATTSTTTSPPATTAAPTPSVSIPVVVPPVTTAPAVTSTLAPTTTTAPSTSTTTLAPGRLSLSTTTVDLGATETTRSIQVRNTGGRPLTWDVGGDPGAFTVSADPGTLPPGATAVVVVSIDRSNLREGDISAVVTIGGPGGGAVTLTARVEQPPIVFGITPTFACVGEPTNTRATVIEASQVSVSLSWSGPASGSAAMGPGRTPGVWEATPAYPVVGTYLLTVRATDARGNVGTATSTLVVDICIG